MLNAQALAGPMFVDNEQQEYVPLVIALYCTTQFLIAVIILGTVTTRLTQF